MRSGHPSGSLAAPGLQKDGHEASYALLTISIVCFIWKGDVRLIIAFGLAIPSFGLMAVLLSFIIRIQESHRPVREKADAIVVFSGAPERMTAAVDLLNKGFAKRVLFAGQDNSEELQLIAANPTLACCVDFDPISTNTAEDAIASRKWVLATNARSLILITTDYHAPRAITELRRLLPNTRIRALGVTNSEFDLSGVWRDPGMARRFLLQFIKYAVALVPGPTKNFETPYLRKIATRAFGMGSRNVVALTLLILIAVSSFLAFAKLRPPQRSNGHKRHRHQPDNLSGILLGPDSGPALGPIQSLVRMRPLPHPGVSGECPLRLKSGGPANDPSG